MSYRLTPFHFLTLYFFGEGVNDFYVLSKISDTELGELVPYIVVSVDWVRMEWKANEYEVNKAKFYLNQAGFKVASFFLLSLMDF